MEGGGRGEKENRREVRYERVKMEGKGGEDGKKEGSEEEWRGKRKKERR